MLRVSARCVGCWVLCAATAAPAAAFGPAPAGCGAAAKYQCLPGIGNIGVAYDAVKGTSFGVGRPIYAQSFNENKSYLDPFGNQTVYATPDQVTVNPATHQKTAHSVYRDANSYAESTAMSANADAHIGFFKASASVKKASQTMQNGLSIIAESSCEIGIYSVTLDPPLVLQLDDKLQRFIDALPEEYNASTAFDFDQFVQYYGTHFVSAIMLGGKATMHTTVTQAFSSTHTDSEVSAQVEAHWGGIGGGGSASSSTGTSAEWNNSGSTFTTNTEGGDPAIRSFANVEQWTAWAKSVETGSPVVTSYQLQPIAELVRTKYADPSGGKWAGVNASVYAYAAKNNFTFSQADLVSVRMGWCNCEYITEHAATPWPGSSCNANTNIQGACPQGKVFVGHQGVVTDNILYGNCGHDVGSTVRWNCCEPCFNAGS